MTTKNEQVIKQLVKEGFAELAEDQAERRFKDVKLKDVGYTELFFIHGEEYRKLDDTLCEWRAIGRLTYYSPETPVQVIDKTEETA